MDNAGKAIDGEAIARDVAKRSEAEAILSNFRSREVLVCRGWLEWSCPLRYLHCLATSQILGS